MLQPTSVIAGLVLGHAGSEAAEHQRYLLIAGREREGNYE